VAFNYFNNQNVVGIKYRDSNAGISNLDTNRLNTSPVGGALFRNTSGATASVSAYTHTWTVPDLVTSVSVVCIGGGGGGMVYSYNNSYIQYAMNGGGGGALAWLNDITVTPGESISIQVGAYGTYGYYTTGSRAGGDSFFKNASTINAGGGSPGRYNTTISGGTKTISTSYGTYGGGDGGDSVNLGYYSGPSGGGGAGGYSGDGGDGKAGTATGDNGAGGGGAGGAGATGTYAYHISGGGGGVAPYGEGTSGSGGSAGEAGGGSGGDDSSVPTNVNGTQVGGNYGGGGGGKSSNYWGGHAGNGGQGVVRVIWGSGRAFPSTNVGQNYLGIAETTYTN